MNKSLFLFLVLFSCIACKKDTVEYLKYDSEIFIGNDTLIYGEWQYLYSEGGISFHKEDLGISILSIKPIGDFVSISKINKVTQGKIQIIDQANGHTRIQFNLNGIKTETGIKQSIYFKGNDTLDLSDGCCDAYDNYYKRIK